MMGHEIFPELDTLNDENQGFFLIANASFISQVVAI